MRFHAEYPLTPIPLNKKKFPWIESECRPWLCRNVFVRWRTSRRAQLQPHLAKLKLLLHSPFDESLELRQIALPRFFLNFLRQSLHPVHLVLRGRLKPSSENPLNGFDEHNQDEQKHRGSRLGRQHRLKPSTHPADQAQIKQRQKSNRNRVDEILLPADIQKIEPQHHPHHHCERNHGEERQRGAQFFRSGKTQPSGRGMQQQD